MQCEVTDIPMVRGDSGLPAQVSLNGASWTESNDDTMYTAYGVNQIYPNSGPSTGGTEITVVGSGFVNNGKARCRFGVPGDY